MAEPRLLTLHEVAKLLAMSERSVRRYVQRGQLTSQYVSTEKGRELRFSETEVQKVLSDMAKTRPAPSGQPVDSGRTDGQKAEFSGFSGTIDLKEFFTRYEHLLGQLGYFQAKAEEVKLLSERAESLIKDKQELELKIQQQDDDHERQEAALVGAKTELEEQLRQARARQRRQPWLTLSFVVFALLVGYLLASIAQGGLPAFFAHP
jgi:predicted DNA-binding transcriptional regulator AlpA